MRSPIIQKDFANTVAYFTKHRVSIDIVEAEGGEALEYWVF
jgi:hypothetical protein